MHDFLQNPVNPIFDEEVFADFLSKNFNIWQLNNFLTFVISLLRFLSQDRPEPVSANTLPTHQLKYFRTDSTLSAELRPVSTWDSLEPDT